MSSKLVLIIRSLRTLLLLEICNMWYSNIKHYLNTRIDKRLAFAYDVGKAYVTAEEEITGMLPQMVDHLLIRELCREHLEADRLAVTKDLGIVQKDRPWIAVTVKTRQSVKATLKSMQSSVNDLKDSGWLDEHEYLKLNESLDEKFRYVSRKLTYVQPIGPKDLFKGTSWMNETVSEYLYNNVESQIYDPGDIVCVDGDLSRGIYVVVTGLLKSTYVPKTYTINRLQYFGILPVMDYISSTNFHQRIEEYLVSGNSFGELSVLTGRPYDCTIIADTTCQVFLVGAAVLKNAFAMGIAPFKELESKIWKSVSIRLASAILMETPAYQSHTLEHIKLQLQHSFIPNVSHISTFYITSMIEDVILIEGTVFDQYTRSNFIAPCYIPRTIQKLELDIGDTQCEIQNCVRLLIIPSKDYEGLGEDSNIDTNTNFSKNPNQNLTGNELFRSNPREIDIRGRGPGSGTSLRSVGMQALMANETEIHEIKRTQSSLLNIKAQKRKSKSAKLPALLTLPVSGNVFK